MTENPIDPLPGDGPPQAVPPAAPPPTPIDSGGSGPPTAVPQMDERSARNWAMWIHLSSFAGFTGIPFANILGPLVLWLMKKEESAFVDDQGKEALNFNISVAIYAIVSAILLLVVVGLFLLIAVGIFWGVCVIIAAIKANEGTAYRYPLTIRFIS